MKGLGRFQSAWTKSARRGLFSLAEQPVYFHSHHHDIFIDQSVADALGGEAWAVRKQAAFESVHSMLASIFIKFQASGPADKLRIAAELFSAMGCGALHFSMGPEGGSAHGDGLYFGQSFAEKYGSQIRNKRVLDAYTSGFVSAAASLSYPSDWGVFEAEETACVGRDDPSCEFVLSRRPERARFGVELTRSFMGQNNLLEMDSTPLPSGAAESLNVDETLAEKLILNLSANENGMMNAFGSRLMLMPAMYTNQIVFDTMHLVEKRSPELSAVFCTLVREAAQMDAFYLLGGAWLSREYREGRETLLNEAKKPEEQLVQLLEIAKALGWGAFSAGEFVPGKTLVLRNSSPPEAIYYGVRHGKSMRARLVFQQGLALGIMHLLSAVDWLAPAPIQPEMYNALFRGGPRFDVEETRSPLRGDEGSEVVVEAIG